MPLDFINYVEQGIRHPDPRDWLTPGTVHGLTEIDFITLPPTQREELFHRVTEFLTIAQATPPIEDAQQARARAALARIWELLGPYRTPESTKVREVLWRAWEQENTRDWIPTFDYRLGEDSGGDPAIWMWLVLNDDIDIEAPETREGLSRLRLLVRSRLHDAGIDRWPYISVWTQSDAKERSARVTA